MEGEASGEAPAATVSDPCSAPPPLSAQPSSPPSLSCAEHSQLIASPAPSSAVDVGTDATASLAASAEETKKERRRRRQWEDVEPASHLPQPILDGDPPASDEARRSRWGRKDPSAQEGGEAEPKRRRSRWASAEESSDPDPARPLQLQLDELNLQLESASEEDKPAIHLARAEIIKKIVSVKLSGSNSLVAPQQVSVKVPLTDDMAPNGLQSIVGLVIGTRGMTQKMLEAEAGCRISVRGKGSSRTKMYLESEVEEDEPCHVLIKGPSEEAVAKTKALLAKLLDFNSVEGEALRAKQRREGHILNGTLKEDTASMDLQKLLTGGALAAPVTTGYGQHAARLAELPPAISSSAGLRSSGPSVNVGGSSKEDDEYALLMAELGEGVATASSSAQPADLACTSTTSTPAVAAMPGRVPPPWAATPNGTRQAVALPHPASVACPHPASAAHSHPASAPPWRNSAEMIHAQRPAIVGGGYRMSAPVMSAQMPRAPMSHPNALGYPPRYPMPFQHMPVMPPQYASQHTYTGFPQQQVFPPNFVQQAGYPPGFPGYYGPR